MWVGVCFHDTAGQILCNRNGLKTERTVKSMSEVGCIRKRPNTPEGGDGSAGYLEGNWWNIDTKYGSRESRLKGRIEKTAGKVESHERGKQQDLISAVKPAV